jgi:hypothetical protein
LTTSKKSLVLNFSRLQCFSYQFFWLGLGTVLLKFWLTAV